MIKLKTELIYHPSFITYPLLSLTRFCSVLCYLFHLFHLSIRSLDRNNIVIIGTVMAQTVALDHYAESVERMIVSFMRMNMKIEQSGNFDLLDKKDLYKLIASNNTVITNILSKVFIYSFSSSLLFCSLSYKYLFCLYFFFSFFFCFFRFFIFILYYPFTFMLYSLLSLSYHSFS